MDQQISGWIIVIFNNDNSVEAVPDIWLKKNNCAWPAKSKQIKKYIERRVKPNNNDFTFFNARKLGNKVYSSLAEARSKLPKAMHKSDISSTEDDEYYRRLTKKRHYSESPNKENLKKTKSSNLKSNVLINNSCPPRYIPEDSKSKKISKKLVINDSDSNHDDSASDIDLTWFTDKNKTDFQHIGDNDSITQITPLKSLKKSDRILNSPSGLWTVTPDDTGKQIINESISSINSAVKRRLIFKENNAENSEGHGNQLTIENIAKSLKDFQRVFLTSHAFIKHEIQCLTFLCHTTNDSIEKLLKEKMTVIHTDDDLVNMDILFPIKDEDELQAFEEKSKDSDFRTSLVGKIALLVGNKDLGNSIRRIMARMFDDQFLSNYSLYGFKKKKSFTS
ncbi:uncharacterized protein LOC111028210 [Myzus persicae]|uniref:uncharacterized protein LOC111028210 n=1 Tax=Myzus persicae TaxID=13164 RepID=UPI000B930912|nr:uncharacterized protein LOC111028210 [Myzus persicae]